MYIAYRILNKFLTLLYQKQERKNWFKDFEHFRSYAKPVLTLAQKKEIKEYYLQYGLNVKTDWHNYYTFMTNKFDTKYIPADLMYTMIVPYLNYMPFELAYQDKGNYNRLFVNTKQPETIIQRMHGFYYIDGLRRAVSEKEAFELCSNLSNVIIKPTINSCQGRGVKLFSTKKGKMEDNVTIQSLFSEYGDNFIVQKRVQQHPFLSSLNESSLNTMRILTLRIGNEVIVLSKAIRVGGKGSITDNGYGGGFCTGIMDDGSLKFRGYQLTTGKHIDKLQNGKKLAGLKIPHFDKVISKAQEMALALPYLRLIGWDFTIDTDNEPVFIEMNTLPGIYIMQLCNGPVFGEYTDEILKTIKSVKYNFVPKIYNTYSDKHF